MDAPPIRYARTSDGVNIAYTVEGQGPVTIFAPHGEGHQGLWRAQRSMSLLMRTGQGERTLVSFDWRAIGLSDRTVDTVSFETRLLDIEAVADAVGTDQFALLGILASGPAAVTYAHRHPERLSHLILWNTYARAKDSFFGVERNVALGKVMLSDWEMFTEISQGVAFGWGRDEGREYGHFFRASVTAEMYAKYAAGDVRTDITDLLPEITVPTLVLLIAPLLDVSFVFSRESSQQPYTLPWREAKQSRSRPTRLPSASFALSP